MAPDTLVTYLAKHAPGFDARTAEDLRLQLEREGAEPLDLALGMRLVSRGLASPEAVTEGIRALGQTPRSASDTAQRWGPYRALRKLGQGGMGAVWAAEHEGTRATYAVKLLNPTTDPEEVLRFRREAEVLSSLNHPNVVRVHAGDLAGREPYLVQELCARSLDDVLEERGPLPLAEVEAIARDLIAGLTFIHERGLLHRDLKPANVLFDDAGTAKLADFGLARSMSSTSLRLTQTGEIMGTPAYMAPEQARDSKACGPAADVYALGAIVYACLAAWDCQDFEGAEQAFARTLELRPRDPTALQLWADLVLEAERWPRVAELAHELTLVPGHEAAGLAREAQALFYLKRYPEALEAARGALAHDPNLELSVVRAILAQALLATGEEEKAQRALEPLRNSGDPRLRAEASRAQVGFEKLKKEYKGMAGITGKNQGDSQPIPRDGD